MAGIIQLSTPTTPSLALHVLLQLSKHGSFSGIPCLWLTTIQSQCCLPTPQFYICARWSKPTWCASTLPHPFLCLTAVYCGSYPTTSFTGWVECSSETSYQAVAAAGARTSYRVYKVSSSYNPLLPLPLPHLNPGDIVVSLQDSTIHWMGKNNVLHLWEGNHGKNQLWGKAVLWWNGELLRWTPHSTQSRQKKTNTNISSLGVKAIVDAIASPVHLETRVKKRALDQTLPTGQSAKSPKSAHGSYPEPEPTETTLLEYSPKPTLESMGSSLPQHLPGKSPQDLPLRPTFHHTHDTSWTSQSCILDAIGEYPEGNQIQEWMFNGLKTISPIHATVRFY